MKMQKKWMIIILLLGAVICIQCKENLTTNTYSKDFGNKDAKVYFLKKYLNLKTEVEDLEYYINYRDNSTGMVPGSSDWEIRAVFKVHHDSLEKWKLSCNEVIETDVWKDWAKVFNEGEAWDLEGKKIACENGYIWMPALNIILFHDSTY